jgi:hypothetical protein
MRPGSARRSSAIAAPPDRQQRDKGRQRSQEDELHRCTVGWEPERLVVDIRRCHQDHEQADPHHDEEAEDQGLDPVDDPRTSSPTDTLVSSQCPAVWVTSSCGPEGASRSLPAQVVGNRKPRGQGERRAARSFASAARRATCCRRRSTKGTKPMSTTSTPTQNQPNAAGSLPTTNRRTHTTAIAIWTGSSTKPRNSSRRCSRRAKPAATAASSGSPTLSPSLTARRIRARAASSRRSSKANRHSGPRPCRILSSSIKTGCTAGCSAPAGWPPRQGDSSDQPLPLDTQRNRSAGGPSALAVSLRPVLRSWSSL